MKLLSQLRQTKADEGAALHVRVLSSWLRNKRVCSPEKQLLMTLLSVA